MIPRTLREVLTQRTIDDLTIKMKVANQTPQHKLIELFFEMCDQGISQYINTEQIRFPNKTPAEIMHEYYQLKQNKHKFEQ